MRRFEVGRSLLSLPRLEECREETFQMFKFQNQNHNRCTFPLKVEVTSLDKRSFQNLPEVEWVAAKNGLFLPWLFPFTRLRGTLPLNQGIPVGLCLWGRGCQSRTDLKKPQWFYCPQPHTPSARSCQQLYFLFYISHIFAMRFAGNRNHFASVSPSRSKNMIEVFSADWFGMMFVTRFSLALFLCKFIIIVKEIFKRF